MAVREKTPFIPDEVYFITFTILGWQKIFTKNNYCDLVFKWFDYIRQNYGNKIFGYVIMPNHIHCLIYISKQSKPLCSLILNAKRFLAYGITDLLEKEGNFDLLNYFKSKKTKKNAKHKIFEDRYDSLIIQTEKFFLEKLNYIHNNPCHEKWNLSERPEDYKYSSASNYILGTGVYNIDIIEF